MRFNELSLSDGTQDAIAAMGYEEATPIQRDSIPQLLQGRDVMGQARTGTGKTAAFGIPMIEAFRDTREKGVLALVLVPTRELAIQVHDNLVDLAKGTPLRVTTAYGGVGFGNQTQALRRNDPTILVACPGRLLDLMERGIADLDGVKYLVLDEADRMLDMGFVHDVRRIVRTLGSDRQTCLFSATLDTRVKGLANDFMRDPLVVRSEDGAVATDLTEQFHIRVEVPQKTDTLLTLLAQEGPEKAVVFTRTKHLAKRLAQRLAKHGWASVALQGNMSQSQRESAMMAFRTGDARLLVATDVASRGLDVPDISHVINFDVPMELEAYVHRIGRTGRNGRTGRSFTFIQSDQIRTLRDIEKVSGSTLQAFQIGTTAEIPRGPDRESVPNADAPRAAGARPAGPSGNGGGSGSGRNHQRGNGARSSSYGGGGGGSGGGSRNGGQRRSGGHTGSRGQHGSGGQGRSSGGPRRGPGGPRGPSRGGPRQNSGRPGRTS